MKTSLGINDRHANVGLRVHCLFLLLRAPYIHFRDYQKYYLLSEEETDALIALALLLSPDKLNNKVIFQARNLNLLHIIKINTLGILIVKEFLYRLLWNPVKDPDLMAFPSLNYSFPHEILWSKVEMSRNRLIISRERYFKSRKWPN